jgi:predicted ester cyclase
MHDRRTGRQPAYPSRSDPQPLGAQQARLIDALDSGSAFEQHRGRSRRIGAKPGLIGALNAKSRRLEAYLNAIDTHNRTAILRTYTSDVEIRAPGTELDCRAAAAAWIDVFLRAFPDLHHQVLSTVVADNQIAAEARFTDPHTGPHASPGGDIAPTGKTVTLDYADVLRFAGESFRGEYVYFDQTVFLTQLGLFPA